jgi:asparagine synthase (glutamine-hydrolysing)
VVSAVFNARSFSNWGTLMAGYLLSSQGDRMLMANSVEGRFPYLDHRVMELAHRLSLRMKMKVLNEKYLLKKIAGTKVPAQVLKRQKQPYQSPATAAFLAPATIDGLGLGVRHEQVPEYVDELMSERKLREYGYLHPGKIRLLTEKIKDALAKGRPVSYRDNTSWIFALSLQIWHRNFQVLEEK